MRIVWVVEGVEPDGSGGYRSNLASNRYRAILPAQALTALGHEVQFMGAAQWLDQAARAGSADVVVMGKFLPGSDPRVYQALSERVLERVRIVVAAGTRVVADFNDDHFDHPLLGVHWRGLARAVSMIVAGSAAMAQRVRQFTTARIEVVGDPVSSPRFEPRTPSPPSTGARWLHKLLPAGGGAARRINLLWYGHPVNWPAMAGWLPALASVSAQQPILLWVVTQELPQIQAALDEVNARHGPALLAELVPWDEATQWSLLEQCDAVLIPSDPHDPRKAVKTANRLTDALHAGRHVIASPLPAYQPWAGYADLSDQPAAALARLMADPMAVHAKLAAGQKAVASACDVAAVAGQWLLAFTAEPARTALEPPNAVLDRSMPLMKLNLGCGDKILPGYVNVDVVAARAGREPDVICDLRDLAPFASDSADEVMAIHVVEHFWRWEIEAVLREWLRVLKPGGQMVIEVPNLLAACEALLANPVAGARADQAGQRTMWVFYGDPAWQDPLMIHRWGYTPQSLVDLLRSVGLTDVRQESAQYKLREPRDMRVVGQKPLV